MDNFTIEGLRAQRDALWKALKRRVEGDATGEMVVYGGRMMSPDRALLATIEALPKDVPLEGAVVRGVADYPELQRAISEALPKDGVDPEFAKIDVLLGDARAQVSRGETSNALGSIDDAHKLLREKTGGLYGAKSNPS